MIDSEAPAGYPGEEIFWASGNATPQFRTQTGARNVNLGAIRCK